MESIVYPSYISDYERKSEDSKWRLYSETPYFDINVIFIRFCAEDITGDIE